MATTAPTSWITDAKIAESSATISDHWLMSMVLLRKTSVKTRPRTKEQARHKPIGWRVEELTYNDEIRERLGMESPVDIVEITQDAYHIYTGGSYTGFRSLHARAKRNTTNKT